METCSSTSFRNERTSLLICLVQGVKEFTAERNSKLHLEDVQLWQREVNSEGQKLEALTVKDSPLCSELSADQCEHKTAICDTQNWRGFSFSGKQFYVISMDYIYAGLFFHVFCSSRTFRKNCLNNLKNDSQFPSKCQLLKDDHDLKLACAQIFVNSKFSSSEKVLLEGPLRARYAVIVHMSPFAKGIMDLKW